MRSFLVVLPALLIASPALAQGDDGAPAPTGRDLAAAARALSDPAVQRGIAAMVGMLSDTVMQTRMGPLASVDPSVRPDDTLGSLAERRDPGFHDRMARNTRTAVGTAGNMVGAAAGMAAEINATADRLRHALAAAYP